MGGTGSGRKSPKALAIYALLGVQMKIQTVVLEGIDSNKSREALKEDLLDVIKDIKVTQEEIERI